MQMYAAILIKNHPGATVAIDAPITPSSATAIVSHRTAASSSATDSSSLSRDRAPPCSIGIKCKLATPGIIGFRGDVESIGLVSGKSCNYTPVQGAQGQGYFNNIFSSGARRQ